MEQGEKKRIFLGICDYHGGKAVHLNDDYLTHLHMTIYTHDGETMEFLDQEIIDLQNFLNANIGARERVQSEDH